MGQAFKKHPKLVFAVSTVWDGLPKNIPNRFLLCPLYRVQFTWLDSSYWWFILPGRPFHLVDCLPWEFLDPQEDIDPKWLPPVRFFWSMGGSFTELISSHESFWAHRGLFLQNYLLLHRFSNFPAASSQKNSSVLYLFCIGKRNEKEKIRCAKTHLILVIIKSYLICYCFLLNTGSSLLQLWPESMASDAH